MKAPNYCYEALIDNCAKLLVILISDCRVRRKVKGLTVTQYGCNPHGCTDDCSRDIQLIFSCWSCDMLYMHGHLHYAVRNQYHVFLYIIEN